MSNRFDREDELERILAETARGVYSVRRNTEEEKTSARETVNYKPSRPAVNAVKSEYTSKEESQPEELVPISGEKSVFNDEDYEGVYEEEALEDYFENEEEYLPEGNWYGEETEESRSGTLDDVLSVVECVIMSIFAVVLVFGYVFHISTVNGDSMLPTLKSGDRLILSSGLLYKPETGDIVVIDSQKAGAISEDGKLLQKDGLGVNIVKRVIASSGQKIDIDFETGDVIVDGKLLSEKYISGPTTRDELAFTYPLEVPEGYVFVMGDNRDLSMDSRHPSVGLVPEDEIIGRVLLRVYPFGSFGTV